MPGNIWIECHVTFQFRLQTQRNAHYIIILEARETHNIGRKLKRDHRTVDREPYVLIDVAGFIAISFFDASEALCQPKCMKQSVDLSGTGFCDVDGTGYAGDFITRMIANQDGSVYSTRCSAAYAVYREDQWQRPSKHTELES